MNHTEAQLVYLEQLGPITGEQHADALAHPGHDALGPDAGPSDYLVWMVEQGIVDDAELLLAAAGMPFPDESMRLMRQAIVLQALPAIEAHIGRANRQLLDELLALGLINETERDCGVQTIPRFPLESPGHALAWLVDQEVIWPQRLGELQAKARMDDSEAGLTRLRVIADAHTTLLALRNVRDGEPRPAGRPLLRLGAGAGFLACALFGGYHAYQWAIEMPGCAAARTTSTLHTMFYSVARRIDGASVSFPRVRDIKEVGYVETARQRGCSATLVVDDERIPYAYVIGPAGGQGDRIEVSSAHPAIVAARFGKPAEDGDFGNQAEPLGRTQLETTLRAALEKNAPRRMASIEDITKSVEDMFSHVDPDRKRVIAEIEPVGNCRAVSSTTYACRVLIERNDPLMSMFGMPADILDVEFIFERSAGGVSWRVSDDVDARYARAIVASRKTIAHRLPGT